MADQIVITEKSSQAKDVRAAVGSRYGEILPAEGHLFDLLEPEDVVPAWKRWSPILLRPEGLYGTRRCGEVAEDHRAPQAATKYDELRLRAIAAQREALHRLRAQGEIGDEAFRRIHEELDWAQLDAAPAGSFQSLAS